MSMKSLLLSLILFVALLAPYQMYADTGIGIQFGHPGTVGLSLRFDNIPIGAAWRFGNSGYLHTTVDVWLLKENLAEHLDWYLGPGVDLGIGDPFLFAARVPVGLQWFPAERIEVFGQLAPGLQIINKSAFYFAGAIGIRFIL